MGLSTPIYGEDKEVEPEIGLTPSESGMSLETFDPSHAPVRQVHSRIKNTAMNQGRIDNYSGSAYSILSDFNVLYATGFHGIIHTTYDF